MEGESRFFSLVLQKCYTDETLRLLELEILCRDAQQMQPILRSHASTALHQIAGHPVEDKLYILDFFVRAFALLGDVQSWLGLTYEGLVFRDHESASHEWLRVSVIEWLKFAEVSFKHHYYCVCVQVCEKALMQLHERLPEDVETEGFNRDKVLAHASSLREHSLKAASSSSVQAQVLDHWKRKAVDINRKLTYNREPSEVGSVLFRNGIKMRNTRNFSQSKKRNL